MMMTAMPSRYITGPIHGEFGKKVPTIIPMMTVFAVQGMKVVTMMVILRSFSFSMVRLPMMAGTPHPLPIIIGMNDLPERPNFRKMRSMMNATRAI